MSVDFSVMNDPLQTAFGETVSYTPRGGVARNITAVVDREPIQPLPESPQGLRPNVIVWVDNDATTGIDVTTLDTGGDTMSFPKRIGDTASTWSILKLVSQDNGMLQLEVR